jgi:hypothetical protein
MTSKERLRFFENEFNSNSGRSDGKAGYSKTAVAFQIERQVPSLKIAAQDRGDYE